MDKYNPFRPNSLVHPGMFSGRGHELTLIKKALLQTKHGNPYHLLIDGERGVGKSSLLMILSIMASDKEWHGYNFLTLRIELESGSTYVELIKKIGHALKQSLSEKELLKAKAKEVWDFLSNWEILGVSYSKKEEKIDDHQLLTDLTDLFVDVVKDGGSEIDGIVLLIDEADKPDENARLGSFIKLFTERLSFAKAEKVLLVLAGLPTVIEKLKASHESAPRVLQAVTLEALTHDESAKVIDLGLKEAAEKNGFGVEITESAKKLIVDLSEGYPHFIQQFSFSAFDADRDNLIGDDDVKNGAFGEHGALKQLGKKFFIGQYYDQINSDDYRKVLNIMAEFSDEWVSRADILKASKLSEHTINNALKALKERNIIQTQDGQKGKYRLPTKSFAAWIKATQSLQDSKKEE